MQGSQADPADPQAAHYIHGLLQLVDLVQPGSGLTASLHWMAPLRHSLHAHVMVLQQFASQLLPCIMAHSVAGLGSEMTQVVRQ